MDHVGGVNRKIVDDIISLIDQLKFGDLVVKVHDSQIVQIDKIEKDGLDII